MATSMRVSLPFSVLSVFDEDSYQGGPLLSLPKSGLVKAPNANEISLNYVWLLPLVQAFPSKAWLLDVLPGQSWLSGTYLVFILMVESQTSSRVSYIPG